VNGNKGESRIEEPTRVQRTIARRAAESRATIPHLELSSEVPAGPGPVLPALVRACARALRALPRVNGAYRDGRVELYSRVNIGVVFPTPDAFAIPTVFDADQRSLEEIATELERLRDRAAQGELLPPELSGGTFTLSQTGADAGAPLVVPGQAAALCAGAVRTVPVVRKGTVASERMMVLTLACDHRVLYDRQGSQFLATVATHLTEEPQ
jgi:pyruvate dehydrogenase E2 component (dihydrolipoamide acetyltransferase)